MSVAAPQKSAIDTAYQSQRLRLSATVAAAVAATWAADHSDRARTIARTIALVTAGQAHVVRLVDAYMAAKALQATGNGSVKGLNPDDYTTAVIRRLAAEDVYARPFGAYGAAKSAGADQARAVEMAQASVTKLARTDLQLAQTRAARDWIADDENVYGWRRVLNGDTNCPLCTVAATRIYYRADLMPIHENCDCTVEALYGEHPGGLTVPNTVVRVADDHEIGPRLLADDWAA